MNFFLSKHYTEFEEFYQDSFRWNLEFRKLDAGAFKGYIGLIDIGDVQVGKIKLNCKIDQSGISPRGFRTFVLPADKRQSFEWLNHQIGDKDLILFSRKGDLEAISFSNFYHYMISVEENMLEDFIAQHSLNQLGKSLGENEKVFRLNRGYFLNLQTFLEILFNRLERKPYLIHSESFQYQVRERLLRMMLDVFERKQYQEQGPLDSKRDDALRKVRDYIQKSDLKNLSIGQLTRIGEISERSLQYAFLDHFGLTPKAYLTQVRLNEARTALSNPTNKELVKNIADAVGFHHPGQFAIKYKELFGESPTETRAGFRQS